MSDTTQSPSSRPHALVLVLATGLGLGVFLSAGSLAPAGAEGHAKAEGHGGAEAHGEGQRKIVATQPLRKDVVLTEQYVCQIRARRHIKVRAQSKGYLDGILVNEGQAVKKGELMFKIRPVLYQAKYEAEQAEARLAELELENANRLLKDKIVSENEVALFAAKLAKANAEAREAEAELQFTSVAAPFDGLVDRLEMQLGSLIDEGEHLTTLSDNSVLWVYFNVPEARYLDYMAAGRTAAESQSIELLLANGRKFDQPGSIGAIEAQFDNETGNIPFRADFPNPNGLLRHGQTGSVLIHHTLEGALVIPQRATFEILDRRYVFVVDGQKTVRQREIEVRNELEDIFVIGGGIEAEDRIVLEGVRQVRDGDRLAEFESREPALALANLKYPAE